MSNTGDYIHDTCYPRTLCSARCKHNSGQGYYSLCQHPSTKVPRPYGGITRYYVGGCALQEEPEKIDGGDTASEMSFGEITQLEFQIDMSCIEDVKTGT